MTTGTKILLITLGVAVVGGTIAVIIAMKKKAAAAPAPAKTTVTTTTDIVQHGGVGSALAALGL